MVTTSILITTYIYVVMVTTINVTLLLKLATTQSSLDTHSYMKQVTCINN